MIIIYYLKQSRSINSAYYASKLRRLRQEITTKRPGKLTCGALPLQDNAPTYTSQVIMTALTQCGFEILPNPPYSPAMAPSDLCLFSKLKFHPCDTQCRSNEGVKEAANEYWETMKRHSTLKG